MRWFFLRFAVLLLSMPLFAQDTLYFRLSAGPPGSTLFAMATQLATMISSPPGSPACDQGGSCGVPGLIAIAQNRSNSVANLQALRDQQVESAIVSGDLAYFAYEGMGAFQATGPDPSLRELSPLGNLAIHIIVLKSVLIRDLNQLQGKRIAIGTKGTDNEATARWFLETLGIVPKGKQWLNGLPYELFNDLRSEQIDAMIIVDRIHSPILDSLFSHGDIRLLDLNDQAIDKMKDQKFIRLETMKPEEYPGEKRTRMVNIPILWLTRTDLPATLAFDLTKARWHTMMKEVSTITSSFVPFHDGANQFYREQGE